MPRQKIQFYFLNFSVRLLFAILRISDDFPVKIPQLVPVCLGMSFTQLSTEISFLELKFIYRKDGYIFDCKIILFKRFFFFKSRIHLPFFRHGDSFKFCVLSFVLVVYCQHRALRGMVISVNIFHIFLISSSSSSSFHGFRTNQIE